jgi:hypothetical protein
VHCRRCIAGVPDDPLSTGLGQFCGSSVAFADRLPGCDSQPRGEARKKYRAVDPADRAVAGQPERDHRGDRRDQRYRHADVEDWPDEQVDDW